MLLAAVGVVVFGPRTANKTPDGRVVVTYWEKWTGFEGEAMRQLVHYFNATEGQRLGIHVEYVPTTGIDLKTMIAITGGDPPDLAGLWQRNLCSFAEGAALESLDEHVSASGFPIDAFIPLFRKGCEYHDTLYALPLTPASIALYYNKDVFDSFADELALAGLDSSRPPRTIAELDAYADVMQRRDAQGRIEQMAYLPSSPDVFGWFWDTWPVWFGEPLVDPATGLFRCDTPGFIEAYSWVGRFTRRFGIDAIARFESGLGNFNSPDNPFMVGQLAMVRQGPWFANMIRQLAPQVHYGVAPFPTADGRRIAYCEQDIIVIPRGARHPDEAWRFLEWLYTSPPITVPQAAHGMGADAPPLRPVERLCWMHCKNSPLRSSSPAFFKTHPNPAIHLHDELAKAEGATLCPQLPNWPEVQAEFAAAYRDIWHTGAPAEDRLHECQERIEELTGLARRRVERYGMTYP